MNVVFDLGNVLIDWNPRYLYRKLLPNEAEVERFLNEICTDEWNVRMDAGLPMAEGIAEKVQEFPEHETLIRAWWERWPEMLGEPLAETVEILQELQNAGTPLYVLSNWSADTYPLAEPSFPFLGWFRGKVISGEVKMKKPDPKIYQHLLERFGLEPSQTVFIDDKSANVAAANVEGIRGLVFTGAAKLRADLGQMGLL